MKTHLISAGDLQVSLRLQKDGMLLRTVTDKKSGRKFYRKRLAINIKCSSKIHRCISK